MSASRTLFSSAAFLFILAGNTSAANAQPSSPTLTTRPAQHGALVVTLASATPGTTIFYTLDGSTPTPASQVYQAPFLVDTSLTVQAVAVLPGSAPSAITRRSFALHIPAGTLVWSEEFSRSSPAGQPDQRTWTYDTGPGAVCCGNHELEHYCAWASTAAPCDASAPNNFIDAGGILHIVARQPSKGIYTSARLKTQGLFSFQYGRIEARMKLPESAGMWPAFWALGNNVTTLSWPACGELDIMEHIDGANPKAEGFDWVQGSIHGTHLDGGIQYHPTSFSAAEWHTYGMIWSKGKIEYYVDDPAHPYATFNREAGHGVWPFDDGPEFILLNLAVGGDWPGSPDAQTPFPSELLVDYVRLYAN